MPDVDVRHDVVVDVVVDCDGAVVISHTHVGVAAVIGGTRTVETAGQTCGPRHSDWELGPHKVGVSVEHDVNNVVEVLVV